MAVREVLLTLLAVEPTYGFRLHTELTERIPQRATLNVGQSYATIERAKKAGLISPAGENDEGLPLVRLTDAGRVAARAWLLGQDAAPVNFTSALEDTQDRVLLTLGLGDRFPTDLCDAQSVLSNEFERWNARSHDDVSKESSIAMALSDGNQRLARTVVDWLITLRQNPPELYVVPFDRARAKRGRPKRSGTVGAE